MAIFSDGLRKAIADYLSGEEHSDRMFEALNEGEDQLVLIFLRGCAVPLGWKKILRHFEGLDEDQLILAAAELLKISYRDEILQDLLDQCKRELRNHEKTKISTVYE